MRLIRLLISCWLFTWFAPVCLATPSTDLTSLLNAIHTIQANFTQTIYDNHDKPIQVAYGSMALERPGKFRWETKKPIPQIIIANEAKLWIYDPDLAQVTIRHLDLAAGDAPALLLSHTNANVDKDYAITRVTKKQGWDWFNLKPRKGDNNYESIQLGFLNNQIQEMLLHDQLGHSTRIKFKQAKINTALSVALFNFKPPANVDVIDETRKH